MRGLRAVFNTYSSCLVREGVRYCCRGRRNDVNNALRWMSHNTPCLKNNLPQAKESPGELAQFGQVRVKEKPILVSGLADLVDRSPILQKLVDLGVEIHTFNNDWNLCKFILSLDYEKNVQPYLSFLCKHGVKNESLGQYLTVNPYILQCDLDDLQVRINYLQSKNFNKSMIAQVISGNPKWLSFEVKLIDSKLGEIQKNLRLAGNDVRTIVMNYPKVVNVRKDKLHLNMIMFKEQLQLSNNDMKKILTRKPILLGKDPNEIMRSFYYLQDEMNVPVHLVIQQPEILACKVYVLTIRHKFLVKLGRAQYNPKLPGYVSLINFGTLNDEQFCETVAMTKLDVFYNFQKTL